MCDISYQIYITDFVISQLNLSIMELMIEIIRKYIYILNSNHNFVSFNLEKNYVNKIYV